ncbi:hypothetical protein ACO0LD_26330 [Undibacterium sp. Ji83W]|uniref:hypothetical protein n=1 Tax=Undibacterium sp. Ji83W TaxID=3413043 RepID=UPI003BEFD095
MLIINMEGMIAGAIIGGIYFLITLVFPNAEYPIRYASVATLFLVIGTVADKLGYQPRIYFAKFKLIGIVLSILGSFMFLGAAMFIVALITSAVCFFLWKRNQEYKTFLHAQSCLANYLADQSEDPHTRKRLLLDALFQNIWLNKKPEFFVHNEKVVDALLSDTKLVSNEDEAYYLRHVQEKLQEQKIQTKWSWKLNNIGTAKRSLTQLLDNQGIGRFRPGM